MKTKTINYAKTIWFKIMNDQMSRHEAIALFIMVLTISTLIVLIF